MQLMTTFAFEYFIAFVMVVIFVASICRNPVLLYLLRKCCTLDLSRPHNKTEYPFSRRSLVVILPCIPVAPRTTKSKAIESPFLVPMRYLLIKVVDWACM